jgi:hypothetical protein
MNLGVIPMDVDENIFDIKYEKLIEVFRELNINTENIIKFLNIIKESKQNNNLFIMESELDKILTNQQKDELTELYKVPFYSIYNQYIPNLTTSDYNNTNPYQTNSLFRNNVGLHSPTMESNNLSGYTSPFANKFDSNITIQSSEEIDKKNRKDKILKTLSSMNTTERHKLLSNMLLNKKNG